MRNFGMYIGKEKIYLVDMNTGEILTENREGVQNWLLTYPNHTLQLL